MNKTQKQFLRLGDTIVQNFLIPDNGELQLSTRYIFVRENNAYTFIFYGVHIRVSNKDIVIRLRHNIDIRDFDVDKLLADMWVMISGFLKIKNAVVRKGWEFDHFTVTDADSDGCRFTLSTKDHEK